MATRMLAGNNRVRVTFRLAGGGPNLDAV